MITPWPVTTGQLQGDKDRGKQYSSLADAG